MKIEVTADDIENGTHHAQSCPVSLAIERKLPGREISTWDDSICIYNPANRDNITIDTPRSVLKFIDQYDNNGDANPFAFNLPIEGYTP